MIKVDKFYLILHPRPAYVIGSGRFGEKENFMAASWVTPVGEEPPLVGVAIGKESYTHELINAYGEFSVNVVPYQMVSEIYKVGSVSGREFDKTKIFRPAKGEVLSVPIVSGAIAFMECKVQNKFEGGDATLFLGEVVNAKADPKYFDLKTGWSIKDNPIPLHNWGKGFYRVGAFIVAK